MLNKAAPSATERQLRNDKHSKPQTEKQTDMNEPTYAEVLSALKFALTDEELQRMDDDRGEREVYRMEDAQDDNSNPPEIE